MKISNIFLCFMKHSVNLIVAMKLLGQYSIFCKLKIEATFPVTTTNSFLVTWNVFSLSRVCMHGNMPIKPFWVVVGNLRTKWNHGNDG